LASKKKRALLKKGKRGPGNGGRRRCTVERAYDKKVVPEKKPGRSPKLKHAWGEEREIEEFRQGCDYGTSRSL